METTASTAPSAVGNHIMLEFITAKETRVSKF